MLNGNKGCQLNAKFGTIYAYPLANTPTSVYSGALVSLDIDPESANYGRVSRSNEYRNESASVGDLWAKQLFVGYSYEQKKYESGPTAENILRVRLESRFRLQWTGASPPVRGMLACVADDNTVQAYKAPLDDNPYPNIVGGRIVDVEGSLVYVDLLWRPARVASSLFD
jgi:hypothetical protein